MAVYEEDVEEGGVQFLSWDDWAGVDMEGAEGTIYEFMGQYEKP